MNEYDGVILGSGHNSLVLQAYASRAGLSTVCLEARGTAGGGLSTIEYPQRTGFLHNIHSFFHRGITAMPWFRDLKLKATYVEPELNVALITPTGQVLEWWTDFEKTVASFARFSAQDAETLRRWRDDFRAIVQEILTPEAQSPPLRLEQRRHWLEQTSQGRRLLEVSQLSPLEFVQREFENPVVQAGLLFFNGLREVDLRQPGFGHHIPALLASGSMAQVCLGGSKQLANALIEVIRDHGGEIRTGVAPQKILVGNGRAVAVEADGTTFRARRFIASGLNPQQTFLDLLDRASLPYDWEQKAKNFEYNLLAPLFSLNLNLSEPPQYAASQAAPHLDDALMVILGLDHVDRFHEIVAHHEAGTIPPTVMWGACPTRFDSSQAPQDYHTAFMWEKLPYRIEGSAARWDQAGERHAEEMLERWVEFAPNLNGAVMDSFFRTPLDTARELPNMRYGDLLVGAFSSGQVGYHRPFPGAGHYRAHLPGLYLCGSSCHPGGNVTGLPGYNCVQVLFADLGVHCEDLRRPLADRIRDSPD